MFFYVVRSSLKCTVRMSFAKDYYSILGVPKTAARSEIKSAFKKLAMNYHPDVSKDPGAHVGSLSFTRIQPSFRSELTFACPILIYAADDAAAESASSLPSPSQEKFVQINEAYTVLSDREERARYDHAQGAGAGPAHRQPSPHQQWHECERRHSGGPHSAQPGASGWSHFGGAWGGGGRFGGPWDDGSSERWGGRAARASRADWQSRPSHTDREAVLEAVGREVAYKRAHTHTHTHTHTHPQTHARTHARVRAHTYTV